MFANVPPLEVCFLKSVGAAGRAPEDCEAAAAAANGPPQEAEALAAAKELCAALRNSGRGAAGCANVWPTNCDWRCGSRVPVPGGPIRRPHSASVDELRVCISVVPLVTLIVTVKERFTHTVSLSEFEMLAPEAITVKSSSSRGFGAQVFVFSEF